MMSFLNLKSIQFSVFCLVLLSSCASIPEDEQLLSSALSLPPQKSNGACSEQIFTAERRSSPALGLSRDHISILSWNIYKQSLVGWDHDFLRLSDGKEIILLQEATLTKPLQELLRQQNFSWDLNNAFLYKKHETGVLMASAIPAIASCGLRTPEPLIGIPKTILIAQYNIKKSDKDLLVANVHGINFTLGTGSYQKQFADLEAILAQHTGPLLVVGDFNNWNESRSKILTAFSRNLSLQMLVFPDEKRTLFWGESVDQVFYRGLIPLSNKVDLVESSDHNPISVIFRLAEGE